MNRLQLFIRRPDVLLPMYGSICWILSVQYFVTQIVTARGWSSYSIRDQVISDLGKLTCSLPGATCTPLHGWMNLSLILLGVGMFLGSLFLIFHFGQDSVSATGFILMAAAGVGAASVGIFPEDSVVLMHIIGAAVALVFGNLALLFLGFSLGLSRIFKIFTVASGIIGLVALVLFELQLYFTFGKGSMERLAAYPQTIWIIIFGIYVLRSSFKTRQING